MDLRNITGAALKKMILSCAAALDKNREAIDALNVFPVPDGDTGTNMSMTVMAAAREADKLPDSATAGEVAKAAAHGSLRGARGNSGVILSQLMRGFAKELENSVSADMSNIAFAFVRSAETAYKAVMKPKEGTILTVASAIAEKAMEIALTAEDFVDFGRAVIIHGNEVLARTPDMLPVLKQAGVVDAGGKGLMCILRAAYAVFLGEDAPQLEFETGNAIDFSSLAEVDEDIKFAYCTEFFINFEPGTMADSAEADMKKYLDERGDSIVVVADDSIIKVHVHTNSPGAILEKSLELGYLSNIKIDNMRLQHEGKISFLKDNGEPVALHKKNAFITVASGRGFTDIFMSIGVDKVIEGGQTMNPSTDDFLNAIEKLDADNIFIFPNNGNIILAAKQAANMAVGKQVFVVDTKSVPQGLSAVLAFSDVASVEENMRCMAEAAGSITTGLITLAVRDAAFEGGEILEGDALCIVDGKIAVADKSVNDAAIRLLDLMAEKAEIISLFYGEGAEEAAAEKFIEYVNKNYPHIETELQYGGQSVYPYIFSAM